MKPATLAAVFALALSGCANVPLEDRATGAAVADGVSTAIDVGILGAAEASPFGLVTIILKYPALLYCKSLPEAEQAECLSAASAVWSGAAANNVLVGIALIADIACGPYCLLGGLAYGIYDWHATAPEREFHTACEAYKRWSGETLPCVYQLSARADADAR